MARNSKYWWRGTLLNLAFTLLRSLLWIVVYYYSSILTKVWLYCEIAPFGDQKTILGFLFIWTIFFSLPVTIFDFRLLYPDHQKDHKQLQGGHNLPGQLQDQPPDQLPGQLLSQLPGQFLGLLPDPLLDLKGQLQWRKLGLHLNKQQKVWIKFHELRRIWIKFREVIKNVSINLYKIWNDLQYLKNVP